MTPSRPREGPERAGTTPAALARDTFRSLHRHEPAGVWSAPARVNLIGEHTDYNDGFVLPFALGHRVAAAASPRADDVLTISTRDPRGCPHQARPVTIPELRPGLPDGWASYPAGVAWVLREQGIVDRGADLVLASDVPSGAGLSSSAAVECAVATALLALSGYEEPGARMRLRIAGWAQRAENEFAGVPTGLLDQAASMCCTEGHALLLDVRSGEAESVPFDAAEAGLSVLVVDTRSRHAHGESGYARRRDACERAAGLLGVDTLRDVTGETLPDALAELPVELRPMLRHVVTENQRVLDVSALLRSGDVAGIGETLSASHVSLRDDYGVSCTELNLAVEAALRAGALGARMIGGGFGGSAIALVPDPSCEDVRATVRSSFADSGLAAPRIFTALPSAGSGRDDPG